ncbi:HEPN domain-containing protein [Candidatus Collierbacteria bacterium]|nr:HEPN domain-containing protein [Candidatus Collierbacteria bacterium]
MTEAEAVKAWKDSAIENLETAEELLGLGKKHDALFFLHLALEKNIKGLHQHLKHQPSLYIHDLYKLAVKAGLEISEEEKAELDEISTFNIAARYDIFKQRLYRKATEEFADKWMEIGKKLFNKYLEVYK